MLYYLLSMYGGVKRGKNTLLHFLGPFMLFIPQLWDEEGNKARKKTLFFILLFGLCGGVLPLIVNIPPPP